MQQQQFLPDSTVRPIVPTYLSAWLDELSAYTTNEGTDEFLDLMRLLWESDNYYPYLVCFPNNIVGTGGGTGSGNILNFNPGETQTGAFQLPVGSYCVSASCYSNESNNITTPTGPGAKIRIYDKATQCDLFYQQFANGLDVFGNLGAIKVDVPGGPHLVVDPLVISPPGTIQWEITNLDPNNGATIQVLLSFACPKNAVSNNVVTMEKKS
jgi:hypothetical protein